MEFDKNKAVEILLEKRFGVNDPDQIDNLLEINIFESVSEQKNALGIGIELVLEQDGNTKKEEYQVSSSGIVYSWGNAPVIDERSLNQGLNLEKKSK